MKSLTRHQFEHIAYHYVGMAEFSGYHSTGGVWVYNHNYVNNAWKMWQEFQKLSDERLSDRESEIRAEYTYCTPPEQTIRTQQATIDRLTEQRDSLKSGLYALINRFNGLKDIHAMNKDDKQRALIGELIVYAENHIKYFAEIEASNE